MFWCEHWFKLLLMTSYNKNELFCTSQYKVAYLHNVKACTLYFLCNDLCFYVMIMQCNNIVMINLQGFA